MRQAIPLVSALLAASPALAAYNLVKEYSGTNFFSGWDFYDNFDNTTNGEFIQFDIECWEVAKTDTGDVNWVSQANATQSKIAYVNDAGHAIVKVDDTSFVPYNSKRDSVCYAFIFVFAPN